MARDFLNERTTRKTLLPKSDPVDPIEEEVVEESPAEKKPSKQADSGFYKAFCAASLAEGLESIGEDGSFAHRAQIARENGMPNYYARPDQNLKLLKLAADGLLKKA